MTIKSFRECSRVFDVKMSKDEYDAFCYMIIWFISNLIEGNISHAGEDTHKINKCIDSMNVSRRSIVYGNDEGDY